MSDDNLPTHVKEMRNYIAISGHASQEEILKEYIHDDISPTLTQAQLVVESLEDIGLDKLALLFSDRSHAEIILENCVTFRKKFADNDFQTMEMIAEAFSKIFEKVERNKFELIGLTEGQISVLTGNVQILSENYKTATVTNEDSLVMEEFLGKVFGLVEAWESHLEESDSPQDFNEGVETGMMRAASELRGIYEEYKSKIYLENKEETKANLTEERGDE